jgi:hypothetical protein
LFVCYSASAQKERRHLAHMWTLWRCSLIMCCWIMAQPHFPWRTHSRVGAICLLLIYSLHVSFAMRLYCSSCCHEPAAVKFQTPCKHQHASCILGGVIGRWSCMFWWRLPRWCCFGNSHMLFLSDSWLSSPCNNGYAGENYHWVAISK